MAGTTDWRKPFTREEMAEMRGGSGRGPEADERMVKTRFWTSLKRVARTLPFAEDLVAAFYCATDSGTDFKVRATLYAALAYFVLPFDIIPDVLPVLGLTDDAAALAIAIRMVAGAIRPEHRARARETLAKAG